MVNLLRVFARSSTGIRPNVDKSTTLRSRIMPAALPKFLRINLRQANAVPANPVVAIGDRVLRYQLLAEACGANGSPIHAPASGSIVAIEELSSICAEESTDMSIVIAVDDEQETGPVQCTTDFHSLSADALVDVLADKGVRGGGGVGFPVAAKLQIGKQHRAHTLIINAVECAPYQSADEALVREHADEIVKGAELLQCASLTERCIIAFQKGKPDALQALRSALRDSNVELHLAPEGYPAGSEQQLVDVLCDIQIPPDSYAAKCGVLVFNVGAARNSYLAVTQGRPCTSRIVTLAGKSLRTPKNFDVPLGTPVSHLLSLCGVNERANFSTTVGDTFHSHFLLDRECGIDINSRCIIAAGDDEFSPKGKEETCTRCGDCHAACVVGLQPDTLLRHIKVASIPALQDAGLNECFECGACTYACPSNIELASALAEGKQWLTQEADRNATSGRWQERFEFLQNRRQTDKARDKQSQAEPAEQSVTTKESNAFSKTQAQLDIAAAVARVRAKRDAPHSNSTANESEPDKDANKENPQQ